MALYANGFTVADTVAGPPTVVSDPALAARLQTAQKVRECLAATFGNVTPGGSLIVEIGTPGLRPTGPGGVSAAWVACVNQGDGWKLEEGNARPAKRSAPRPGKAR